MKIWFEDNTGTLKQIDEVVNKQEAWKCMHRYLDEIGFHSYYTRIMPLYEANKIWIDFGSHAEFFHVTDLTNEEMRDFLGLEEQADDRLD